ncbi:MAG TPA: SCO family protein [Roseiarcus sp.]|nr:SCO family protein [Roseiarcus sp.]
MPPDEPNAANPQSRVFPIRVALMTAAIAVLALIAVWLALAPKGANQSLVGGPFALEDGSGKTVSEQTLRGRPFLVYFGYTHCPDVCPTELAHISDVLAAMGDKAVPALFITVDPERDTPKVMQDYASSFGPHVIGLSGSPQAIGAVEKEYRVFARKGKLESDGSYSMDHSSVIYLMDKTGGFVEALNVDRPPEEAAKEVERYL